MKHFRLKFIVSGLTLTLLTASAALLYGSGDWPWATLLAIASAVVWLLLARQIRRLIRTMSTFVSALEMNDVSVKYSLDDDDPELRGMSQAMNRITELYRRNNIELETRKLYYDRILRVMTHEMRNAITPIISLADDMMARPARYATEVDESYDEALSVIADQSKGIKHFLEAYYSLTHLPPPEPEAIPARDFFSRIGTLFGHEAAARGLESQILNVTVARELVLNIDVALMTQAIINLLRNSLDAISGRSDGRIELTATVSEGQTYLRIEDNGPGVADEIMENLFQPFMTTKPGGSGIGLCLSRQIERPHGGDLKLTSRKNHGASVMITLP